MRRPQPVGAWTVYCGLQLSFQKAFPSRHRLFGMEMHPVEEVVARRVRELFQGGGALPSSEKK